jgi:hypothetical protein
LPADVIVITPPRASDSNFTEERPPRKTLPERPYEARVGLCQTDEFSHRRLVAPILTMSSEEEICKTCTEADHHERTTQHRASSPQVQPQLQLRLHSRGRPKRRSVQHAETRADYQSHCRDQTITHQHRCCHASHHAETSHRRPLATMLCKSNPGKAQRRSQTSRRCP